VVEHHRYRFAGYTTPVDDCPCEAIRSFVQLCVTNLASCCFNGKLVRILNYLPFKVLRNGQFGFLTPEFNKWRFERHPNMRSYKLSNVLRLHVSVLDLIGIVTVSGSRSLSFDKRLSQFD